MLSARLTARPPRPPAGAAASSGRSPFASSFGRAAQRSSPSKGAQRIRQKAWADDEERRREEEALAAAWGGALSRPACPG